MPVFRALQRKLFKTKRKNQNQKNARKPGCGGSAYLWLKMGLLPAPPLTVDARRAPGPGALHR